MTCTSQRIVSHHKQLCTCGVCGHRTAGTGFMPVRQDSVHNEINTGVKFLNHREWENTVKWCWLKRVWGKQLEVHEDIYDDKIVAVVVVVVAKSEC